ncbi:tetratricopeptide repeat protein [Deinococcus sp.]|uniref:tetratricopeptide repeat protein n=1 Tax=Deinococcus sp. TaxID=47478 RepID=UPI0025DE06FB|nr:tetratricopeptide repeat protein [Deinococcus sp.]
MLICTSCETARVPTSEFTALLDHLGMLLGAHLWDAAYLHARLAIGKAQHGAQSRQVLERCLQVPAEVRLTAPWAPLIALIASRSSAPEICEVHLKAFPAGQAALQAWVLMQRDDAPAALSLSEQALEGEHAALAWRMRAWALAHLGRSGWPEAYREAVRRNQGRGRGLCLLQLGAYLSLSGDEAGARSAYAESSGHFAHDPELRANALYNVGTACLRLQDLTAAGRAYQGAMRTASQPAGIRMLARAWSGLGHVYRARAEFPRALHAYDMAQTKATEADDIAQAWRGKAHTLRLLGRLDEALSTLHEALTLLGEPERHNLYADMAATLLMLGDMPGTHASLRRVPAGSAEETQRVQIVQAELLRRQGQPGEAMALLHTLDLTALWTAEEMHLFPELFALIDQRSPPRQPMQLQVRADGPVRACLNGLLLEDLPPTRPAASLLALLVVRGGTLPVSQVLDEVTLSGQTLRARKQHLSKVLGELRDLLGWPGALSTDGRTLKLSSDLVLAPLVVPEVAEQFCAGLEDEWTQRWREDHDEHSALIQKSSHRS